MMCVAIAVNNRNPQLIPTLVSLFTWSKAYHCELIFSNGKSLVVDPSGVYWSEAEFDPYQWVVLPLPQVTPEAEAKILSEAQSIIEKKPKYDWLGAIFGKFAKFLDREDRWFCSELTAYLLRDQLPKFDYDRWISPAGVWRVVADYLMEYTAQKGRNNYVAAMDAPKEQSGEQ